MKTINQVIYVPSRKSVIKLWHLTDLHIGARTCDEARLRRDVQRIAEDPNAYWGYGGDGIDAICRRDDKRYNAATLARWAAGVQDVMGVQIEYLGEILRPIAAKCLYYEDGNHENAALQWYDRNIYWEIVKMLASMGGKRPEDLALGINGFVNIIFRRGNSDSFGSSWRMPIYTHHGWGGGKPKIKLNQMMNGFDADLYLMGHLHENDFEERITVTPGSGRGWKEKHRIAVASGSYLGAYIKPAGTEKSPVDTYVEKRGMTPKALGAKPIYIVPNTQRIYVEKSSYVAGEDTAPLYEVLASAAGL